MTALARDVSSWASTGASFQLQRWIMILILHIVNFIIIIINIVIMIIVIVTMMLTIAIGQSVYDILLRMREGDFDIDYEEIRKVTTSSPSSSTSFLTVTI